MKTDAVSAEARESRAEIVRLQARVAKLEAQLADVEAWANRALVDAQVKTYWLDRWHLDLNAIMRRRGADRIRAGARGIRSVYRAAVRFERGSRS